MSFYFVLYDHNCTLYFIQWNLESNSIKRILTISFLQNIMFKHSVKLKIINFEHTPFMNKNKCTRVLLLKETKAQRKECPCLLAKINCTFMTTLQI